MCTVTWLRQSDGYTLFSNRDEKRSRPPALLPALDQRNGVRFLAPVDPAFGGTWIACNELGVSLALLNGIPGPRGATSRGSLVLEIADAPSLAEVSERLESMDLTCFAAFTLVAIEPRRATLACTWDTRHLSIDHEAVPPFASSSVDYAGVRTHRQREFSSLGELNVQKLRRFHASHVCMHREDAQTVSFTEIRVTPAAAELIYQPGAPCEHRALHSISLARRT